MRRSRLSQLLCSGQLGSCAKMTTLTPPTVGMSVARCWLQVAAVRNWWGDETFRVVSAAVLAGVAVLLWGAVPALVKKCNSDPPLKSS